MKSIKRKQIPNCTGYFADRKGNIYRKHNDRWIKVNPVTHAVGYQYTRINGTKQLTQRLVCSAFKGESIPELPLCIRKAKRQQPRRVRSQRYLQWGTYNDKKPRVRWYPLTRKQQLKIIQLYKNGATQTYLASLFGVTQPAISYLVNKRTQLKRKKHEG